MDHILQTKYIPCAAVLVPGDPADIVSAGKLVAADGSTCSYVAYGVRDTTWDPGSHRTVDKGIMSLMVSVWHREAWMDTPRGGPPQGFAANLFIEPPELATRFSLGKADWADAQKKLLRVPYTLGEIKGVIEIHCSGKDFPWPIRPIAA